MSIFEDAQQRTKLSAVQIAYIEWCATGMVWPKNFAEPVQIDTVTDFVKFVGIGRRTVYDWEQSIPNFWDMVEDIRGRELSRKLGEYYKWAELSARPITRRVKDEKGNTRTELVRAGSAEHLKILLGQSGRKRPERTEVKTEHTGEVSFTNQVPRNG